MDVNQLKDFLREYLKDCNGYQFIDDTLRVLDAVIASRPSVDCQKFADWVVSRDVKDKTYPMQFLRKCGFSDISAGMFDEKPVIEGVDCALVEFSREGCKRQLLENGISATDREVDVFCFMVEELVNTKVFSIPEIKEWNKNAIRYLANKGKSASELVDVMRRSKTMRERHVSVDELLERKRKFDEEWSRTISDLFDTDLVRGRLQKA